MADEKIYTNIGHVTAYAYAKSKGYTGSEDQFATDQANFAANAQQVRGDKESVEATVETFGNTTVPAAVQTVTAEGTRQVGIVGTAGDTQVARVQGEGTTQVGVVQTEGTTQKNAVQAKGNEVIASIPSDYTELTEEVNDLKSSISDTTDYALSAYATDTASGAIATFPDGADGIPIKQLSVAIEPVQEGSGDPSPDNIRPISGHTECNVTRTGANLWSNDKTKSGKILMFPQFGSAAGVYNSSSNSNLIKVLAGETYYVRIEAAEMDSTWGVFGATKSVNAQINHSAMGSNSVRYFTFTPTVDDYWAIWLYKETNWTEEEANAVKIQVTKEYYDYYVPYTGTTYPITFPSGTGTVYGGNVTVNRDGSGSLVVDRVAVDLGTLTWSKSQTSGGYRFTSYADNVKPNASASAVPNCLCSQYNTISPNGTWSGETGISINISSGQFLLCDPSKEEMSVADFKTAMSGVQLVYELATPLTIPLTASQITTLLGTNNVWSDTGDVSVIYRADTAMFIQKKIAEALNA